MYEASFVASSDADWQEAIEAINDITGQALDISDALIEIEVKDACGHRVLFGSTGDGTIGRPASNQFRWTFPLSTMNGLSSGQTYRVGVRLTTDDGTTQILIGSLALLEGNFS